METQDLWVILLMPVFVIIIIWSVGVGECKRIDRLPLSECAMANISDFGSGFRDGALGLKDSLR